MATNRDLNAAKVGKSDEFWTTYETINAEMQAYLELNKNVFRDKTVLCPCDDPEYSNFTKWFVVHFQEIGLKRLICTSYAAHCKQYIYHQTSLFEQKSPQYNPAISELRGKVFIMDRSDDAPDMSSLKWSYLDGTGDYASDEVTALRDEADIICTNPPFSIWSAFIRWILDSGKNFSIIGNINAVTYKDVFPAFRDGKMWLGASIHSGDRRFFVPDDYPMTAAGCGIDEDGRHYVRVKGVRWFTDIDYKQRHETLQLMTMADNIKYSKHREILGKGYCKYVNFDAIDVPYTDAIPSDYEGVLGVPISFIDKWSPDQFELLGTADYTEGAESLGFAPIGDEWVTLYRSQGGRGHVTAGMKQPALIDHDGKAGIAFKRIFIKKR